jgi:hypothetical protein
MKPGDLIQNQQKKVGFSIKQLSIVINVSQLIFTFFYLKAKTLTNIHVLTYIRNIAKNKPFANNKLSL